MARRDFNLPDDFPDMSLPERSEPVREPRPPAPIPGPSTTPPALPPAPTPTRSGWREGDRVFAPWEPDCLYAGRVTQVSADQALIEFDDGDSGWVPLDRLRGFGVKIGERVFSRRRGSAEFFPGTVIEVRGDEVSVNFDGSRENEWAKLADLRISCQPSGPGAAPAKVGSQRAVLDNLRPGDRVWAPWANSTLFVGTVDRLAANEVLIRFDDGDQGWVLIEQVVPLELPVGLRIMGRWKMGPQFYPGTVAEAQGDRVHVHYDDGDKEWTTTAALALPCQPFGPNARPTRVAAHAAGGGGGAALGWLVPLIIIVVLVMMRGGCR